MASLKFSLNRKFSSRLYSAVSSPVIYYVLPMQNGLSNTEELKFTSAFFKHLKFLLPLSLYRRNTYVGKLYKLCINLSRLPELEYHALAISLNGLSDCVCTYLIDTAVYLLNVPFFVFYIYVYEVFLFVYFFLFSCYYSARFFCCVVCYK